MPKLTEIRCGKCSKKLGAGNYAVLQIICPRCKTLNDLRAVRAPNPERRECRCKGDVRGEIPN